MNLDSKKVLIYAGYVVIALFAFSITFTHNGLLTGITTSLLGLFIVLTNKYQVDGLNKFYIRMATKRPSLYPPDYVGKTSYILKRCFAVFVGLGCLVIGLNNIFHFLG